MKLLKKTTALVMMLLMMSFVYNELNACEIIVNCTNGSPAGCGTFGSCDGYERCQGNKNSTLCVCNHVFVVATCDGRLWYGNY